jgi:Berberine and berberine like
MTFPFFGAASFNVKAGSDDAYRSLIRKFVSFYREHLFNDHWGEQAYVTPDNRLLIMMNSQGLDTGQATKVWQPFLDWDPHWWKERWPEIAFPRNGNPLHALLDDVLVRVMRQPVFAFDHRPGAGPNEAWFAGSTREVGEFLWAYESLWLPASLLESDEQQRLADALFASSRYAEVAPHFNKGLAGAPSDAVVAAKDTATNPAVQSAFALAIVANGQGPAYPGIPGHEPSVAIGRKAAARVDQCMNQLRAISGVTGSYVSESNYFQKEWQQAYWGSNYPRLAQVKQKYDPDGPFFVHNGVGSEGWSTDGFTKL